MNLALRERDDESYPTWPFITQDYDATALFRCKAPGETSRGNCPGGILRMKDYQDSIVVQNRADKQFTINFMTDHVNAANRQVKAPLDGDQWTLEFGNSEVWEVPLAAIDSC